MKIPIFDIENWKEIGTTLARNKTRTFLTGFGIFWGTAMLAILLGGARGAKDLLMRNFDGFATNMALLFDQPTTEPYMGHGKDRTWNLDFTDIERLRRGVPELKTVTYSCVASGSFKHGKYSYSGTIMGAEPQYAEVFLPHIYSGRFINRADMASDRKVALVGKKIINELYPDDEAPLGKQIEINGVTYSIIGVMGQTNDVNLGGRLDESVMIPGNMFMRAFNRTDKVDLVLLVAKDGEKITTIAPTIRRIIYFRHAISPTDEAAMQVFDVSEKFEQIDNLFLGLSWLAFFIGFSTLIAGVIGVGNIMWVIVKERTQEIGIRRAIGAKPSDIIVQVLSEGMLLTTVAGLAGICFAALVLGIAQQVTSDASFTPHFQMNLSQALTILTTFVVLGTLAGLIPATKAMKIKPVEALNDK